MKMATHCDICSGRRGCCVFNKGRGACKDFKEDKHETQDAKEANKGSESKD